MQPNSFSNYGDSLLNAPISDLVRATASPHRITVNYDELPWNYRDSLRNPYLATPFALRQPRAALNCLAVDSPCLHYTK